MLKIGDFSKLSRVTIKTLHYYDEIGLIKPSYVSQENGYRYYQPAQLQQIAEVVSLKEMGFSLDEIAILFKQNSNSTAIYQALLAKQTELEQKLHLEKQRLAKVNALIKSIEEETLMNQVNLKELPEVIVASMRMTIPNYENLNEVVPAMGEKMRAHGAICREPAYCFNIYHDGEYKESEIDVEICEAVVASCPNTDGVVYKKIPAIQTAACIYHQGPYSTLGKSYAEVFKWIEANGYQACAPPRESYIDGCWNKEDPSEWLTEIQVPISKK